MPFILPTLTKPSIRPEGAVRVRQRDALHALPDARPLLVTCYDLRMNRTISVRTIVPEPLNVPASSSCMQK
jgi:hypothetical protein